MTEDRYAQLRRLQQRRAEARRLNTAPRTSPTDTVPALDSLDTTMDKAQKRTKEASEDPMYRAYYKRRRAAQTSTEKDGKERVKKDVEAAEERRKQFTRRRAHYADADVSFVNERNRRFNEKLG